MKAYEREGSEYGIRIVYMDSKKFDSDGRQIVYGPWCINERELERWWIESETAHTMRTGELLNGKPHNAADYARS